MFAKVDKEHARLAAAGTLIGAGTVLSGDIVFSGALRIDGEVRGNVRTRDARSGTLVIGERGRIEGDVNVARLVVHGVVTGRVDACELVQLRATARIDCDVVYTLAEIDPGAVVSGQLLQNAPPRGVPAESPPAQAEAQNP